MVFRTGSRDVESPWKVRLGRFTHSSPLRLKNPRRVGERITYITLSCAKGLIGQVFVASPLPFMFLWVIMVDIDRRQEPFDSTSTRCQPDNLLGSFSSMSSSSCNSHLLILRPFTGCRDHLWNGLMLTPVKLS